MLKVKKRDIAVAQKMPDNPNTLANTTDNTIFKIDAKTGAVFASLKYPKVVR